jgi:hypothetical protein
MEALIVAQYLGSGEYDLAVEEKDEQGRVVGTWKPRYMDVYSAESGLVRLGLAKDAPIVHALGMGDWLHLRCTVRNQQKGGANGGRAFNVVRLQIVSFETDQQRISGIEDGLAQVA